MRRITQLVLSPEVKDKNRANDIPAQRMVLDKEETATIPEEKRED